jgi:hypothetical protein
MVAYVHRLAQYPLPVCNSELYSGQLVCQKTRESIYADLAGDKILPTVEVVLPHRIQ